MISQDRYRKSSFSGGGSCVEVRLLPSGQVAVRDSKQLDLPASTHTPMAWKAFLSGIRAGEFDRD